MNKSQRVVVGVVLILMGIATFSFMISNSLYYDQYFMILLGIAFVGGGFFIFFSKKRR